MSQKKMGQGTGLINRSNPSRANNISSSTSNVNSTTNYYMQEQDN